MHLEPAPLASMLEELEEWERYLKAEPEVIHKLRAFDDAAAGRQSEPTRGVHRSARVRGPSL
tara:strand:+ start:7330 stop:7515 length:186 start_codon:yes stop_codon:yes gene_type:complete